MHYTVQQMILQQLHNRCGMSHIYSVTLLETTYQMIQGGKHECYSNRTDSAKCIPTASGPRTRTTCSVARYCSLLVRLQ